MSNVEERVQALRGEPLLRVLKEHSAAVRDRVRGLFAENPLLTRSMVKKQLCSDLDLEEFPAEHSDTLKQIILEAIENCDTKTTAADAEPTQENGDNGEMDVEEEKEKNERESEDGEGEGEREGNDDREQASSEESGSPKKLKKKKISAKRASHEDQPKKNKKKRLSVESDSSNDEEEEQGDENEQEQEQEQEQESDSEDAKKQTKAKDNKNSKKSSGVKTPAKTEPTTTEEKRLEFLKRCVRECRRHVNYSKLFPADASASKKVKLLEDAIRGFGVKGPINLKNCQRMLEEKELEELQRESEKLLAQGGGRRSSTKESSAPSKPSRPSAAFDTSFLGQEDSDSD